MDFVKKLQSKRDEVRRFHGEKIAQKAGRYHEGVPAKKGESNEHA